MLSSLASLCLLPITPFILLSMKNVSQYWFFLYLSPSILNHLFGSFFSITSPIVWIDLWFLYSPTFLVPTAYSSYCPYLSCYVMFRPFSLIILFPSWSYIVWLPSWTLQYFVVRFKVICRQVSSNACTSCVLFAVVCSRDQALSKLVVRGWTNFELFSNPPALNILQLKNSLSQ